MNCETIWSNCLNIIRENISASSYKTWFEPIKPVKLEGEVLTIMVPSHFFYEWLEEHYVTLLRKTIRRELGENARLEYRIVVDKAGGDANSHTVNYPNYNSGMQANPPGTMPLSLASGVKNPFVIPGLKKVQIDSKLNPNYTFDSYVEGACNRLARSAGYAVANKPGGTAFNPLVIFGGTGMGKTHLAQAIGNQVKESQPNLTVLYVRSEEFANQFFESLKNKHTSDFMYFYQLVDVLIVDDIQFFKDKNKTQDMFFHIFNHLHQNGKQLILTSDRAPKDLEGMEERLLSRFKWGLSADLTLPDFETRVSILKKKMAADGIIMSDEVVEFVAYNIDTNIRELEGAMISLLAQSSLNQQEITLELAKGIVKKFVKSISREISIDMIQRLVCEFLNVDSDQVKLKTRKREVVQARQLAMYMAKNFTSHSLKVIGKQFGGRDHSTVIHSCQTVQNQIDVDSNYKNLVDDLTRKIQLSFSI